MAFRTRSVIALCASLLASCAASSASGLQDARAACNSGARHVEAQLSGFVVRVLGIRSGESGTHEGFLLAVAGCSRNARPCATQWVKVEDNVDITGVIPLHRGDRVELLGQYECDDGVVHWTHRDPRGRHISGYVTVNGRTYQ